MPELPEVETMRTGLERKTKGRTISKVDIIKYKKADRRIKKLALAKIKGVKRRAKLLVIELSNSYSMVIHVKLTGYELVQEFFMIAIPEDLYGKVEFPVKGIIQLFHKH